MNFPQTFIRATEAFGTRQNPVPAPYLRRSFTLDKPVREAQLLICGLGFYTLSVNGRDITKGPLAPYISNPTDILYYDRYDAAACLVPGENVIGVCLGNGFMNALDAGVWDFEKATWRGAPQVALSLRIVDEDGSERLIDTTEGFVTTPSPIRFDDLRFGETYDAREELPGWDAPGFDASGWTPALRAPHPGGECRLCEAEPIVVSQELRPVDIVREPDGYRYDFGVNTAGVFRLTVQGTPGQQIELECGEMLADGRLTRSNIRFNDDYQIQIDRYICRGGGTESYVPTFTYHGFRYILVRGITAEQATPELLTCLEMHSDLPERGNFSCSDETINKLQEITRRSDLANFFYFPTDCPQREKNGWTADAALSAEQMLLNFGTETSLREWLRNIAKAQNDEGALPGIIPTGGWGFAWGNGPGWDCAAFVMPYYVYLYRGDKQILHENAPMMMRYLHYLTTKIRPDGLVAFGLGDWCTVGRLPHDYKAPIVTTDSIVAMDICRKAAYMFGELGLPEQQRFADGVADRLRAAIRERLIDFSTMTVYGRCQGSQTLAIHYGVFEPGERAAAFSRLLELIAEADDHMDVGVVAGRTLFHVLSDFGRSDLAFEMITRPDFPSYGNWIARGATSLWETFFEEGKKADSLNHHFWGDISSWFIQRLAGIRFNPHRDNWQEADIAPAFISQLTHAEGFHIAPAGRISSAWKREGDAIVLTVEAPGSMTGQIRLEDGWLFDDGLAVRPLSSGSFRLHKG